MVLEVCRLWKVRLSALPPMWKAGAPAAQNPALGWWSIVHQAKISRGKRRWERKGTTYIHHRSSGSTHCLSSKLCMAQCPGVWWRGEGLGETRCLLGSSLLIFILSLKQGFLPLACSPSPRFYLETPCRNLVVGTMSWLWCEQITTFCIGTMFHFHHLYAAQSPFPTYSSSFWL